MGIDFHALTLPEVVFKKHQNSRTLQLICNMQFFYFDAEGDEELVLQAAESFVEENGDPTSDLKAYFALIKAGDVPTGSFGMGKERRLFDEVFSDLADQIPILEKVFHSGEEIGVDETDAVFGQDLVDMVSALKKVRLSPDNGEFDVEGLNISLAELITFYESAVEKKEAVLRGLY